MSLTEDDTITDSIVFFDAIITHGEFGRSLTDTEALHLSVVGIGVKTNLT